MLLWGLVVGAGPGSAEVGATAGSEVANSRKTPDHVRCLFKYQILPFVSGNLETFGKLVVSLWSIRVVLEDMYLFQCRITMDNIVREVGIVLY